MQYCDYINAPANDYSSHLDFKYDTLFYLESSLLHNRHNTLLGLLFYQLEGG